VRAFADPRWPHHELGETAQTADIVIDALVARYPGFIKHITFANTIRGAADDRLLLDG